MCVKPSSETLLAEAIESCGKLSPKALRHLRLCAEQQLPDSQTCWAEKCMGAPESSVSPLKGRAVTL